MTRHSERKTLQLILLAMTLLTIIASGCGGSLYRVKPVADLPPMAGSVKSASAGGITIRVAPLLSDEESQDLFEANLPLSGVLPLRVALNYENDVPVELKKARVKLTDHQGREWKMLAPKQAVSRILKANGVTLYNPHSRKRFEEEFGSYGLDLKAPLTTADRSRHGFLFFQSPTKGAVENPSGLTLKLERVPHPLELVLN